MRFTPYIQVAYEVAFAALLAMLAFLALATAPPAHACDAGNWYDPTHQVCAPYPPAYPPPNYAPPPNIPYPPSQWPTGGY
jgi:hypothetical protein